MRTTSDVIGSDVESTATFAVKSIGGMTVKVRQRPKTNLMRQLINLRHEVSSEIINC
jgi:hypothetical protein